jgi:predicted nucleotide-binding protein
LEVKGVGETEPPKAFIAHEGKTKALDKLEDFLDTLGIEHQIAEKMASEGRLVEPHFTQTYEKADFVIVLATKGKAINKKTKKHYMGLNVADELARAREAKKKVILLAQKGVELHTNISGIVYERFTTQNMDEAFIKIIRELKNWGFLKIEK